jgi:hypothetical protein
MHHWPAPGCGEIPTPELVAAWVALDTVPSERIPHWAAHWLVQGHDGETLRKLAGLSGTDPHEVHDILPEALAHCTAAIPDSEAAAAQVAFGIGIRRTNLPYRRTLAHAGRGSRAASHSSGIPRVSPRHPMPVCDATIPPTIAAVVSTSPPASMHAVTAAG